MDTYNDFQNMVRSNNIEDVIDRYREWRGRDLRTPEQIRSHNDVKSVLDAIYASCPSSHAALIRLAEICSKLSPKQFDLLIHILRNGTLTQYALSDGVSTSAVSQRWKTVVGKCPDLSCLLA